MKRLAVVLYPGYSAMSFAVVSVFDTANLQIGEPAYNVCMLAEGGGAVRASSGFDVAAQDFSLAGFDTVLVAGSSEIIPSTPGMTAFLSAVAPKARRIGAICTGAFLLAEAGLLDGLRATTHWAHARQLQKFYPKVKVDEDKIFIKDTSTWTSAGMTAGIDLALAMVEEDHGPAIARATAQKLVVYHRRTGGQSQHSVLLELDAKSDRIQTALNFARRNLQLELSVPQLADAAHLSPRQFSRAFRSETGQSPAKAVERLRVEAARVMMEEGRHQIETVAQQTGFGDRERMRRAFLRAFGQSPHTMRRFGTIEKVAKHY